MQDTAQGTSTQQETPAYDIKGRTMSLEEWDLNVQVERPVDFISLAHHGCDIRSYYEAQGLMDYFNMCIMVQHTKIWLDTSGLERMSMTRKLLNLKKQRRY